MYRTNPTCGPQLDVDVLVVGIDVLVVGGVFIGVVVVILLILLLLVLLL